MRDGQSCTFGFAGFAIFGGVGVMWCVCFCPRQLFSSSAALCPSGASSHGSEIVVRRAGLASDVSNRQLKETFGF